VYRSIIHPSFTSMPPKPLHDLTGAENTFLSTAARLQAAVLWVEQNPPTPEKWAYLNAKVKEEIVGINIIRLQVYIDIVFR
jgi:hypothetical protein